LVITADENRWLERMARSAKEQRRHVVRAAVMLGYANGETISSLARQTGLTRKSVGKWVGRALEAGVYAVIEDARCGHGDAFG
jgi:transposase-like protein